MKTSFAKPLLPLVVFAALPLSSHAEMAAPAGRVLRTCEAAVQAFEMPIIHDVRNNCPCGRGALAPRTTESLSKDSRGEGTSPTRTTINYDVECSYTAFDETRQESRFAGVQSVVRPASGLSRSVDGAALTGTLFAPASRLVRLARDGITLRESSGGRLALVVNRSYAGAGAARAGWVARLNLVW